MGEMLRKLDKKLLLFTLIGIFVGIVLFAGTAGTLKATDTADFCASCHVYESTINNFKQSNHANLNCNDCHTPNDSKLGKYTYKAKSALSHGYMQTLGASKIPTVIHATESSKEIVQQNCVSCHEPSLQNVDHGGAYDSCIDCHRQVPHGKGDFRSQEAFEKKEFFFVEPGRK
ncbi:NapC/NirT family cytochrome c [Bacillaceae bacterium IKA-2]|nr:NapC/NirT family cytochrome c [Bacillaceae bacterium IKA-2]